MHERSEKILLWIIRLCVVGILFLPLIVIPQALFLYIFGKAILFQLLVEIAFGAWLILCLLHKTYRAQFRHAIMLSLVFFLCMLIVTAYTGIDPSRSFWSTQERMTGIIMYLHLFLYTLVLSSTIKRAFEWKFILTASIAVNAIVVLFGFLELHIKGERLASTLGNPVFFAAYALFHVWIAGYLFFQEREKTLKWIYGCSVILNAIALIIAGSRGVFFAFFIGLIFFLFSVAVGIAQWSQRRLLLFGILLLLTSSIITLALLKTPSGVTAGKKYLPNVIARTLYGGSESNNDRLVLWTIALQGWKERPLLGWGWDNYRAVYEKYLVPRPFMNPWYDHSHNQLLDILVFTGSIGVLSYLFFWFSLFVVLVRVLRSSKERQTRTAALCICAFFLSYFIQNMVAFDSLIPLISFFTAVSLLIVLSSRQELVARKQERRILVWCALVIAEMLIIGIMWHVNIKPFSQSREGIHGVVQLLLRENIPEALVHLKKSFAEKSMVSAEVGLQLAEIIGPRILNPTWSPTTEQRKNLLVFLTEQFEKEIAGQEKPNYIQHYIGVARLNYFLFRLTGDVDLLIRAENNLRVAQHISPQRHQIFAQFADIAVARKQYDRALEYQKRAIDLSPESSKRFLYWSLAHIYIAKNSIAQGFEALKTAHSFRYPIYMDDSLVIPLVLAINNKDDQYRALVSDYIERMVQAQPQNLKILGAKIIFLKRTGAENEARELLRSIIKQEKRSESYLHSLFESVHEKILP